VITRRTILRGAGAAVAVPWLEILQGAEKLSSPPLRMAFMFMPNGVRPDYWTPAGDAETGFDLPQHLEPLARHRDDFLLVENLWNKNSVGRNGHWPKVPAWLHGGYVQRSTGRDLDVGGTSADQLAARHIG
jgi:hypothetical protein